MEYFCGPSNFPKWFNRILSFFGAGKFCKTHDDFYKVKADGKLSRKQVDKVLWLDLRHGNMFNKWVQAPVYYSFVRALGWIRWGKK